MMKYPKKAFEPAEPVEKGHTKGRFRPFDPIGKNYAVAKEKLMALHDTGHKEARELNAEYERLVQEGYSALTRLDEAIGAIMAFEKEKLSMHQEAGKEVT